MVTLGTSPATAQGIEEKTQVCAGCHGQDGKPIDKTIPTIWGQQVGYIYIQLRDFKRGDRKSDIMQPIASALERQDMMDIAEYFSKKPWPDLGQPRAPKDVSDRAVSANRSVGCTGCHLDHFQGDGTVPRLAGMGREYLTKNRRLPQPRPRQQSRHVRPDARDLSRRSRGAGGISGGAVNGMMNFGWFAVSAHLSPMGRGEGNADGPINSKVIPV